MCVSGVVCVCHGGGVCVYNMSMGLHVSPWMSVELCYVVCTMMVCVNVLCHVSGEDVHVCHCYCVCLDNAVYSGTACITVIVSEILCVRGAVLYSTSTCILQCCVSL